MATPTPFQISTGPAPSFAGSLANDAWVRDPRYHLDPSPRPVDDTAYQRLAARARARSSGMVPVSALPTPPRVTSNSNGHLHPVVHGHLVATEYVGRLSCHTESDTNEWRDRHVKWADQTYYDPIRLTGLEGGGSIAHRKN